MSDAIVVAIIGLAGTAAGAVFGAYVGNKRRVRAELEGDYDADLRRLRLEVYPRLWSILEPLAKYARKPAGPPTRTEVETMAVSLRRWYFNKGGIYLSAEARQAYFQLQHALTTATTASTWSERFAPEQQIDGDTFDELRKIGSWLRTALTYDVGTRRRFLLAPEWQQEDAAANRRAMQEDTRAKREAEQCVYAVEQRWGAKEAGAP